MSRTSDRVGEGMGDWLGLGDGLPLRIKATPTASVMLASTVTMLPLIADAPILPPLGFMTLIAWRLMRSDLWPVWIGLPLGLWDDLMSGQPVGSAVALWTIVMLGMDTVDRRVVWRGYKIDIGIAGIALAFVLLVGAVLARAGDVVAIVRLVTPQYLWSLFLIPLTMLLVARLDEWRLRR